MSDHEYQVVPFVDRVVTDPATGGSRLLSDVQAEGVFFQDVTVDAVAAQQGRLGLDVRDDFLAASAEAEVAVEEEPPPAEAAKK